MARKRRKRRSGKKDSPASAPPSPPLEALTPLAPTPEVDPVSEDIVSEDVADDPAPVHAESALAHALDEVEEAFLEPSDDSCLSHPSYNLDHVCDDCATSICRVCSINLRTARLCADCFQVRVARRRRGGSWHGWVALAAGLFALGAVAAPFTLAVDPEIARAFPGGRSFFIYGSSFTSALAVFFGLGAQDYNGFGKRAGIVAAILGMLAFCVILVMNVVVAFGTT